MLDARRHREFDLVAALVALGRVRQHAEIVRATADQILDQIAGLLRSDLAAIQRLPVGVGAVLDGEEQDELLALERLLPGDEEAVGDFGDGEVARLTGFGACVLHWAAVSYIQITKPKPCSLR